MKKTTQEKSDFIKEIIGNPQAQIRISIKNAEKLARKVINAKKTSAENSETLRKLANY